MRREVLSALDSLSDREQQEVRWGRYEQTVGYYDDLSLNVHILYDDTQVLPDPESAVGTILFPGDVAALREVHQALNQLLDDLGDRADREYLSDPRWPGVVEAARIALAVMRSGPQ